MPICGRRAPTPSSTSTGIPGTRDSGLPTVMAFGVLADVATGYADAAQRADPDHRHPHRSDVGHGGAPPGAAGQPHDGDHRQRRAGRVPGAGLSRTCSASRCSSSTIPTGPRPTSCARNLAPPAACPSRSARARPERSARRRHRHHAHGGQDQRHHPDRRHDRARHARQRCRRRLPRQDRAAPPTCCARDASSWNTSPRRASRAISSRCPPDFAVTEFWRVLARRGRGRRDAQEVTVFDSVGFAIEDFSALHVMGEAARDLGIGQTIDLIAASADPKDLFGLLGLEALSLQSAGRQEAA